MKRTSAKTNETHPFQLEDHLCFAVYAASHLFNRLYRERLESIGITYPQYLAILALADGQSTVGELGRKLHLDSGTLTPLLKRLEKEGFVSRVRDPADERRVLVELTAKGKKLHSESRCVPTAILDAKLDAKFPDFGKLRDRLLELVDAMSEHLDEAA